MKHRDPKHSHRAWEPLGMDPRSIWKQYDTSVVFVVRNVAEHSRDTRRYKRLRANGPGQAQAALRRSAETAETAETPPP